MREEQKQICCVFFFFYFDPLVFRGVALSRINPSLPRLRPRRPIPPRRRRHVAEAALAEPPLRSRLEERGDAATERGVQSGVGGRAALRGGEGPEQLTQVGEAVSRELLRGARLLEQEALAGGQ